MRLGSRRATRGKLRSALSSALRYSSAKAPAGSRCLRRRGSPMAVSISRSIVDRTARCSAEPFHRQADTFHPQAPASSTQSCAGHHRPRAAMLRATFRSRSFRSNPARRGCPVNIMVVYSQQLRCHDGIISPAFNNRLILPRVRNPYVAMQYWMLFFVAAVFVIRHLAMDS